MKTTPFSSPDLTKSILSLPPIARSADGSLNAVESKKIVDWLSSAAVTTFVYGGVGGFFNISMKEYAPTLDMIEEITPTDAWVVPAIGPDFGKASDQIAILRERDFPTAILLPLTPVTPKGVATGLRRLSDAYGRPLMVFFKDPNYLQAHDAATLLADGVLCTLEYGIPPEKDGSAPYLSQLLDKVGNASQIIDGAGERSIPATAKYGLKSFTSGSGIIAPHLSMALLAAVLRDDFETAEAIKSTFAAFDALRAAHAPIPTVHDGVRLAGIAETGPFAPFFSNIDDLSAQEAIRKVVRELRAASLKTAA